MTLTEAIRKLIKDNNSTIKDMAERLGYKTLSAITNIELRNNTHVSTLIKMVNAYGYDVVLKPRYGDNKVERTIVVDSAGGGQ